MAEHHGKLDKLAITSRQKFEAFIYVNNRSRSSDKNLKQIYS